MSNAAVSGTSNDEVNSPLLSTPEPSNFLFVNETSDTPSFKQGKRRDVKSHVRRLAHERFRKTHKTAQKRATTLPRYATSASQNLDSETFKDLEHDRDCSSRGSPITSSRLSTPDSISGVTLIELYESESPNNTILQSTVDESPEPSELQGAYCKACGQPLQRLLNLSKDRSLMRRNSKRRKSLPNLVGVLGAGRVDPFSTLPMEEPNLHSQELVDQAVTYVLPGLIPDNTLPSEVNPVTKAYFSSGLRNPLVFHAIAYVGSNHLSYLRSSTISSNAPTPLFHKTVVIQKLKEALSDPDPRQALADEIIFGILVLASHETFMAKDEKPNPFNSPLPKLGWRHIYGNSKIVPQHAKAIADIVAIRGGLETIKLYKLAEIIISADITSATNSFTKPRFPPLNIYITSIAALRAWAISPPRRLIQTQSAAFWRLQEYGITESMLQALDSMGAYALAVGHYLQGRPFSLSSGELNRARLAIQHRLVSVPPEEDLIVVPSSSSDSEPNIYEYVRLTALIFGVAVVYPIPNPHNVLVELVRRLKIAIEGLGREIGDFAMELSGVLLWILVLGGIASSDKPERPWFVSQLVFIVRKLHIMDWDGVEDILESFLWLESACGKGGRELWDEAMASSYIVPLSTDCPS